MSIRSDHKALLFVGAIAVLGAGVRVARAFGGPDGHAQQPALERQMQSADSARKAGGKRRAKKSSRPEQGKVAGIGSPTAVASSDQRAHVGNRLDLDVATATQIDSLPGMSASISKRIVADRMAHGPFASLARLTRVKGVTTKLLQKLDTLVVFSGTIVPPQASDSVIARSSRAGKPR